MNRETPKICTPSTLLSVFSDALSAIKRFFSERPYLLLLYWPVFFLLFELSETGAFITHYHTVQSMLDNYIPFCSPFVIPYIAWFFFVGGMTVYTYLFEKKLFVRYMTFVVITYSVGLAAFFLFPTVQHLRPTVFTNPDIFDRLVIGLYSSDTNTGVCPSLHVTGQFAVLFAAFHSKRFQSIAWRCFFVVSSVLVCASTVLIKQHSVLDVFAGIFLCAITYPLVYMGNKSREVRVK